MKNIRKGIIFIIFILIIILIAIIIAISIIKNKEYGDYEVMGKDFSDIVHSLSISNFSTLEEFVGTANDKSVKIGKKYSDFFTVEIPKIKKELSNYKNASEYYQTEQQIMKKDYFEIDEQSFINLCEKINSMKSNLETEYDNCSFSLNETGDILIITCSYKNGEAIVLEMSTYEKISVK